MNVIELAQEFIRLDTSNPPGNEWRITNIIEQRLKNAGFDIERLEKAAGRPNIIALWRGEGEKVLIIHGHMDTVPAGKDWKHDPFAALIENGKLYGRGACDMKGGLAAMIFALENLRKSGWKPKGTLIFAASANEEMGDNEEIGIRAVAKKLKEFVSGKGFVLLGDTTDFNITIAEKGVLWLEILSHGKEAHGSTPWKGINAIEKLGKFLTALNKLEFEKNHPLLGRSTISINTISGGYKTNVVPGSARATVDIRLVPGEDKQALLNKIKALLDKMKTEDSDMNIEIKEITYLEPIEVPTDLECIQVLKEAVKAATGKEPEIKGEHGATGASYFMKVVGLPTIACGPGKPEQAHVKDEWIELKDIENAVKMFENLIKNYLS